MAFFRIGGCPYNLDHPDTAVIPFENFGRFICQIVNKIFSELYAAGQVSHAVLCISFEENTGYGAGIVVIGAVADNLGILAV